MVRFTRFLRVAPRACLREKCKASRLPILVKWICCFVRDGVLPKIKTLLIPAASASSLPRAFLRVWRCQANSVGVHGSPLTV